VRLLKRCFFGLRYFVCIVCILGSRGLAHRRRIFP
jgi:hypothetical protein